VMVFIIYWLEMIWKNWSQSNRICNQASKILKILPPSLRSFQVKNDTHTFFLTNPKKIFNWRPFLRYFIVETSRFSNLEVRFRFWNLFWHSCSFPGKWVTIPEKGLLRMFLSTPIIKWVYTIMLPSLSYLVQVYHVFFYVQLLIV
jgi:hypothetical protein